MKLTVSIASGAMEIEYEGGSEELFLPQQALQGEGALPLLSALVSSMENKNLEAIKALFQFAERARAAIQLQPAPLRGLSRMDRDA